MVRKAFKISTMIALMLGGAACSKTSDPATEATGAVVTAATTVSSGKSLSSADASAIWSEFQGDETDQLFIAGSKPDASAETKLKIAKLFGAFYQKAKAQGFTDFRDLRREFMAINRAHLPTDQDKKIFLSNWADGKRMLDAQAKP